LRDDETAAYYDTIAEGYDELHGAEQVAKYRVIAHVLALPLGARVLDVGAGTGVGYAVIPSVGVDPSAELLRKHPHPQSVVARAEDLPFPDASFDAVISVTALHHTHIPRAVAEMARVSRGPVVASVLKRSPKRAELAREFERRFGNEGRVQRIEEAKDSIFIAYRDGVVTRNA
jgi:ubiquinone/menaquinone biosynthesis C-methylase UbiE